MNNDLVRLGYSDDIRYARRLGLDIEYCLSSVLREYHKKNNQKRVAIDNIQFYIENNSRNRTVGKSSSISKEPTIKRFCDTCEPSVPEPPLAKPEVKPKSPSFWGTAMDLYLAQDYMKRVAGDKGMGVTGVVEGGLVAKKLKKHMGDENPGLLESATEVYVAQDYAKRVTGKKDMGVTGFVEGGLVGKGIKKRMR